jgi:hypothetical protein
MLASISSFDKLFTIATVGASFAQYFLFATSAEKKGKIPVQFDWWGNCGLYVDNAKIGALLYPALVAGMSGLAVYSKNLLASQADKDEKVQLAIAEATTPVKGENPLKTIWRTLGKRFLLQSFSLLTLALQHYAHDISLGKRGSINAWFVRGIVLGYATIVAGHSFFGTSVLLQ